MKSLTNPRMVTERTAILTTMGLQELRNRYVTPNYAL